MAERLTETGMFMGTSVYKIKNGKKSEAVDKLAHLEDIREKYDIESLDELSNALEFAKTIGEILYKYNIQDNEELEELLDNNKHAQDVVVKQLKEIQKLQTDRDTWQKACELACEREDDCYVYDNIHRAYEFYQQAKTEGNDE